MKVLQNRFSQAGRAAPQKPSENCAPKSEAQPEIEESFVASTLEAGQDALSWLSGGLFRFNEAPRAPMSDKAPKRVQSYIQKTLIGELRKAEPGTELHRYGKLLQAQQIAARDPEESDKELHLEKLSSELTRLSERPEIAAELNRVKAKALIRYDFPQEAAEQRDFIASSEFYQHLRTLGPDERTGAALEELAKLRQFAPDELMMAKVELLKRDKAENLLDGLKEQDPEKLGEFVQLSAKAAKAPPLSNPAARILGQAFAHTEDVADMADVGQQVTQLVGQLKVKAPEAVNEALRWVSHMDDQGMLTTVMTASSLISTFQQEFQTPEERVKLATHLVSASGSASQISQLPLLADALSGTGLASGITAASDILGPIGSVMSVGLNGYEAVEAASEGQTGEAVSRAASALGSSLILGAALIPSPLTPLLVVGGASLSIGGIVGNRVVQNQQERDLMEELGLLKE